MKSTRWASACARFTAQLCLIRPRACAAGAGAASGGRAASHSSGSHFKRLSTFGSGLRDVGGDEQKKTKAVAHSRWEDKCAESTNFLGSSCLHSPGNCRVEAEMAKRFALTWILKLEVRW